MPDGVGGGGRGVGRDRDKGRDRDRHTQRLWLTGPIDVKLKVEDNISRVVFECELAVFVSFSCIVSG